MRRITDREAGEAPLGGPFPRGSGIGEIGTAFASGCTVESRLLASRWAAVPANTDTDSSLMSRIEPQPGCGEGKVGAR